MSGRPEEGEAVSLTDEQRQRARAALRAVEEGVATKPQHLTEWKAAPSWGDLRSMSAVDEDEFTESGDKWVPVSNIVGIDRDLVREFMEGRMKNALRLFVDEEFQPYYPHGQPYYMEVCGDFYVSVDGSHRSIACRTVGIDEVYAHVETVDVDESEYEKWVARRDREYHPDIEEHYYTDPLPEYRGPVQRIRDWLGGFR